MNYYYITGTSKGIGKALAEQALSDPTNRVIGISRTKTISHPNYQHHLLNLSLIEKVNQFKFEAHPDAKKIILINNAGLLGEVKPVGKQSDQAIAEVFNVNLIAPSLLMNRFMNVYKDSTAEKIILNISSGAAKNPIEGWSAYCASKAAIDMYSKVIAEEQKRNKLKFKIISLAPGIVDTHMQAEIRKAVKEDFPRIEDFVNYKNKGQLTDPVLVSKKIFRILASIDNVPETVISIKD